MLNLYGKVLFVSAVSNLKRQCFVYVDEECTLPVRDHPLIPGVMATVYIVIRPSMIASQPRASSVAGSNTGENRFINTSSATTSSRPLREEKPSALGRELLGGIRFVFLDEPTTVEESEDSSSCQASGLPKLPRVS